MTLCAISLGGNLGDVHDTFVEAERSLGSSPDISQLRVSHCYRSTPMGAAAGSTFLNAAAVFETSLAPLRLLDRLHQIEHACGRVRSIRWGPRTLDLDLLLYGEEILRIEGDARAGFSTGRLEGTEPRLVVPHPALWYRRFVLDPLLELIPNAIHPIFGRSLEFLRERLRKRPLPLGWAVESDPPELSSLGRAASSSVRWLPRDAGSTDEAAIFFARPDLAVCPPQTIHLPDDESAARQLVTDVLTAALDEPVLAE